MAVPTTGVVARGDNVRREFLPSALLGKLSEAPGQCLPPFSPGAQTAIGMFFTCGPCS